MQGAKHWKFTLFFLSILYFIWSIHHCHHHHRHHAGQEQTLGSGWLHLPSAIQVVLWESPSNFIPSSHLDLIWKHVEIWLVINGSIFKIYLKSRTIVDLNVMTLCSVDWLPSSQPLGRLKKSEDLNCEVILLKRRMIIWDYDELLTVTVPLTT